MATPILYREVTLPIPKDGRAVGHLVEYIAAAGLMFTSSLSILNRYLSEAVGAETASSHASTRRIYEEEDNIQAGKTSRFWQIVENFSSVLKLLLSYMSTGRGLCSFRSVFMPLRS